MFLVKKFRRVFYSTKEGIVIWYALTCQKKEEYSIMNICSTFLHEKAFNRVFVLTYDRMRRFEGVWHMEKKLLFPAHIFFESEDRKALTEELRRCPILNDIENELFVIRREEEMLLKELCDESGNLRMSEGIIREGIPQIVKGPLKGMESRIRKIDRHKRLAKVDAAIDTTEMEYTGSKWSFRCIPAGLEIKEKTV